MTVIVILVTVGLVVYCFWRAFDSPVPNEKPKCSVCGSNKRTLEWLRSWEGWYCWPCKENCIHAILDSLTGELA